MTITIEPGITIGAGISIGRISPFPPPTIIGQPYGGGFYAGQISTAGNGIADYYLIIGPLFPAQSTRQWKTTNTSTPGTSSVIDGPANTAAMIAAGAANHPAAQFCDGLDFGGYSDWYMPAKNELEICYFNLKPNTGLNTTFSGINPNAVPPRASNYTGVNPAQTSAAIFRTGDAQPFTAGVYWSSTENGATVAWNQDFSTGLAGSAVGKANSRPVRAVRRERI